MSLRRRLLLILGVSFCVLWALAAAWLYSDLRDQMRTTLDQRLAASARMVAGLIAQLPEDAWNQAGAPVLSTPQSAGVACQISSSRGQVLMRTHGRLAGDLDTPAPGFTDRVIAGEHWRLFTFVQNGLHITTADRLAERAALQRNVIVVAVVPFVVALLGSLIALWFGIRRGLDPLARLHTELSRRDPDTLTSVEIDDAPAELRPAINTLNALLLRTGKALAREQRFTSDAAHELRTPLTEIKTHVQLASRVPADQAGAALARAEAGIARLQRTLEQLLTLARIEAGSPISETESVASAQIVAAALADLPARERVEVHAPARESLEVALPRELAAAALRNLLENALRHTPDGAAVELTVCAQPERVLFNVSDRGDWPPTQSTQQLTQRFWRQRHSPGHVQGSGLGLTIVAAIAARFGGSLELQPREGGGLAACFAVPRVSPV